ncbi:ABC transporter permease [Speluncibacter jeojiensis]|uniref:ABC transporter permease n=1 Tax=Speluncibacter jeojiensis TaxID=2710754 RepID=A0A9X4LZH9_9ACTN|nr:ABC transporter permease [Corynebacteriales bacterium D3-21]
MTTVAVSAPPVPSVPTASARRPRPVVRALTRGQGLVGVVLVAVIALAGLAAPLLTGYGPTEQIPLANLVGPNATHWLGTDEVNRDVLTRTLYGIRVDLVIAFVAVPLGAAIGALAGLAATVHPALDAAAQRVFDVILAFPLIILAITLVAITGAGVVPIVTAIVLAEIPIFGRLIRTSVLKVRELDYIEAAEVIGAGRWWVLRTHVLPNALEPLGVQLALSLSLAVFAESAMSFIGIGVRPPAPSLGSILAGAAANLDANPAYALGPLAVISGLGLGFLLVAQALGRARRV